MKRSFILIVIMIVTASCRTTHFKMPEIDIERALKEQVSIASLCSNISVIPLIGEDPLNCDIVDHVILEVMKDYFLLLDQEQNIIAVYDKDGEFRTVIKPSEKILDITVSKDDRLDVLVDKGVLEYSPDRFSDPKRFVFQDCKIELTSLARRDDNVIVLTGVSEGEAYDCEYFIDKDWFIVMESPSITSDDYRGGRFFRCNDSTHFYYSTTGDILYYTHDDYIWPFHQWDLSNSFLQKVDAITGDNGKTRFVNVQRTTNNLYRVFNYKGDNCLLITDIRNNSGKNTIVKTTSEGVPFPIGIIHNNTDYYLCRSSQLSHFLKLDLLKEEESEKYENCLSNHGYVILEYTL